MPRWRRRGLLAGVVGALLVVVSACGGGAASSTSSTLLPAGPGGAPSEAPLTRVGPSFTVLCAGPTPTVAPGIVSVPGVVGIDLQDAVDHTVCAGLRVQLHPHNPSSVGNVAGQAPAAGAEVPSGTTVTLSVHST